MDYNETLDWMYARLPMFQRQGAAAFRKNLDNILKLDEVLDHPHRLYKCIHVGGTNGKGSTAHMLAAVLKAAGYKTGLYTSPHLKDFRERIRINGVMIDQESVVAFIAKHQEFIAQNSLSFFELTVGMAFDFFAQENVDVAVIEVGMGGRLDATNIITPEVSVITNIGLDHTLFLGDTLPQIAREKAGIIKPKVPVVIGEKQQETTITFIQEAVENGSEIYFASEGSFRSYTTDLKGSYQKQNQKTVLQTLEVLQSQGTFLIKEEHIASGLQHSDLKGRWQQLREHPKVICDTAHNREGLSYVLDQIKAEGYKELHMVLGFVKDKDLDTILPLFPQEARYYFAKPNLERGLDSGELKNKAKEYGLTGLRYATVEEAYNEALKSASEQDFIYVGGSTFVVAEVI